MYRRRTPYDNESAADFFSFDAAPQSQAHRMRFAPPRGDMDADMPKRNSKHTPSRDNMPDDTRSSRQNNGK